MKQTISKSEFRDAFNGIRPNNFSYEGLGVLFEYLEELGDSCGQEVELDVIAICCDFNEDSVENIASDYGIDLSETEDEDEKEEIVREYLEDQGVFVGEVSGGFVYHAH
jgi:hypothetical protein